VKPKLYLVKPAPEGAEPPASAEEDRDAVALRDAIDRGDEPLSRSLRAAWLPEQAPDVDHDALLARALGDEDAPPTQAELAAARRLRDALDGTLSSDLSDADADAALLRALGRAHAPPPLDAAAHEVMLDRVLADPLAPPTEREALDAEALRLALDTGEKAPHVVHALRAAVRPASLDTARNEALIESALRRVRPRRRAFATIVAGALAIAAGIALFATSALRQDAPADARASLIRSRSTADLFDAAEPFPRSGGESSRIDRIAAARASELRTNRFAAWGVR
jgi:hypothetical protein